MYPKYKCFGCGEIFRCREVSAVCPVCKNKGMKIKEDSKFSEKEWRKAILKAKRCIEKFEWKEEKNARI